MGRRFRLRVWDGNRTSERTVMARSYQRARSLYLSPLPPGYIGTLEPLNIHMEHNFTQKSGTGYGDVHLECSCGWKSRTVNMLGDNYAMHTLSKLKDEHLKAVRDRK